MNKALQIIDIASPLGNLDAYTHWANQIPILSATQERQLAMRFHEQHDLQAARQLVMAHLRFVIKIAKNYAGYGLIQADLIQEGNIGLMKAVKRFNPALGVRLVSFAVHWIKAEIHEFILRNWRIVKVATTKAQRKLFFNLRHMKKRLGWFKKEEVDNIAATLKVKASDITTMEQRLNACDLAFDSDNDNEDSHNDYRSATLSLAHHLPDDKANPAMLLEADNQTSYDNHQLMAALQRLDSRSQDILHSRWLKQPKATLHQLAKKYKLSAERIRQLEQQAMERLKAQWQ